MPEEQRYGAPTDPPKESTEARPTEEPGSRAFVAVRLRDRSWVVDIPLGESMLVGPGAEALVAVDAMDVPAPRGRIRWDGRALWLVETARWPEIFVGGKRIEGEARLEPGEELTIGPVHFVVGISSPELPSPRRALTHAEFRERLAEELARAARGARPTALVMAQAKSGEGGALLAAALERVRAGDVVATYAHDEIEMLLPDTPRERANAVIERVLGAADLEGVVIGIAVAPSDAEHPERLMRAARNALRARLQEKERLALPPAPDDGEPVLEDPASRAVWEKLEARAADPAPILLVGEPSAGKVAFARRLHRHAGGGPLVVIACGPRSAPEMLEHALAEAEQARGGTLVLDEVGELSPEAQARWVPVLRALAGAARRVATTCRDLRALVERGAFSVELGALLAERDPIAVPPLRQRPDDILPLAQRFAEEFGARSPRFSAGALARLRSYPWPGNVLELRNAVERAVRLAGGGEILAEHLPGDTFAATATDGRLREHVDSVERDAIVKALAESNHNQTHAARRLGLSRRALIYKMEKYGLKAPPGANRRR